MRPGFAVAVSVISVVAAFIFLLPIFSNIQNWGLYDWDQHMFYHESARISLLAFHEFPLWTPYYCGGNVLLANAQSAFLSPFFVFVLLFGAVVGLKLEALAYLAVGLAGTFLVAGRLGCSRPASSFAAAVFMFSSWYAVRVVVGHTTLFPYALLPLVFFFYLGAVSNSPATARVRSAVAAAAILAVIFLSGGIYPFYSAVVLLALFSVFDSVSRRKVLPVAAVAGIFLLAALLSAVKLLPVVDFTSGVDAEKDVQFNSGEIVLRTLLSREQSLAENDLATGRDFVAEGRQKELLALEGRLPWGWHEYSAYLGVIPLVLAAAAALNFRRNWKLLAAAFFFFWLSLGSLVPGPWLLLRQIPFFSSLHGPSRFVVVFAFFVALLAAKSLSSLRLSGSGRARAAFSVLLALLAVASVVDLALVSRDVITPLAPGGQRTAFPITPLVIKSTNLGSPEVIQMLSSAPYSAQFPNLLQGIGTLNCFERLHLRIRAVPQLVDDVPYPGFIGNAYLAETNETLNFTHFSPNRVSLRLSGIPKAEDALSSGNASELTLVINQNYYKGWALAGSSGEAGSYRGLLATLIKKDDLGKAITFSYSSRPFAIGAVMSAIGLVAALIVFFRPGILRFLEPLGMRLESYVFRQS